MEEALAQMRSRSRGPGWLAPVLVVVAILLVASGYLVGATGLVRLGGRTPSPGPTLTPTPTPSVSIPDMIDGVESSAVTIDATKLDGNFVGSGFVAAAGGVVLTNAHVVRHAFRLAVVDREGTKYQGHVVGFDPLHDVAAVKVTGLDRQPLSLAAGPATVKAGTEIYVVGNPGGTHPNSVLKGLVSRTGLSATVDGVAYTDLYQLDAANVAGGNSGSPVIVSDGSVIGMVALGETDPGGSRFAYAIPVATFRQEAVDWGQSVMPIQLSSADLPWQTDPKQAVVQQQDLRAGYTKTTEGPTQFAGTGLPVPSDEVTFTLSATQDQPGRRLFSRIIVYGTRADSDGELSSEYTSLLAAGGTVQAGRLVGELSYAFTQTASDGTTTATVIWRDRNVLGMLQLDGVSGSAAAQQGLDLAGVVEQRVASSPPLNPDAP